MTSLISLISFLETPLGQAFVAVVPDLVQKVIGVWHQNGTITSDDIVNYIASQKSFDELVPKRLS